MSKKTRVCLNCSAEFISYNPNPKYCSKQCKNDYTRNDVDVAKAIELYESGLTQAEVGVALGVTQRVIFSRFKEVGYESRVAYKRDQWGENNDSWKGGRTTHSDGYIYVKRTGHPRALKCGDYVLEHILIVESVIGRYLAADEVVHHIDGNKQNNVPDNLYLTTLAHHTWLHSNGIATEVTSNLSEFIITENTEEITE